MTNERAHWLAWSTLHGVGPVLIKRIYEHFGSLAIAWEADLQALLEVDGIGFKLADAIASNRSTIKPTDLLEQHCAKYPDFWTPADIEYPSLLFEIADPPPVLYYRGHLHLDFSRGHWPTVGIVGTRSPSEYGKRWTRNLSVALTRQGFTIASGLANGIDAVAHRSCLNEDGYTVAVLGTGVDIVYPPHHQTLYDTIANRGLLLSEYANGTPPDRTHFPRRNRIIAGLSRAVLVTEAPQKSGALITARLANDYGRDVYVLPSSLDNTRGRGCLELLNQGGHMILGEAALLEALGSLPQIPQALNSATQPHSIAPQPQLPEALSQVYAQIPADPVALDTIVLSVGLTTGGVLSALVQLELMGLVTQLPGMQYQRTHPS
ncbi:MAG: DNA-processing protein DprA [Cyanobacteria bacterium J06635_15]